MSEAARVAANGDRAATRRFQIGCDIGGTFTDVVVVDDAGGVFADKSDTTPAELQSGMMRALERSAERVGVPLGELLASTTRFVNGTTVVTNAIAELKGARVGLITTQGHGDMLRIARSARTVHRDPHKQRNLEQIVPRERVIEVRERVDKHGRVVVALDAAEARRAIDELVAQNVESIAISLLWSFANPAHEELIAEIVAAEHPDVYVSVASRLHPVMREYERTMTAVLNSFTGLRVAAYTRSIEGELEARGLRVPISFMQGFGGTLTADEARQRPIALVDSGPAGGVVGATELARRMGVDDVLTADMGGTSFDVAVVSAGEITVTQRVMLGDRFLTGLSKIDVHPVGAGGGSIGWIDSRGLPRVGPQSAGAVPGPACYGQGGAEPTVTDVSVALGMIDPDWFLGGRRTLDADAATSALERGFGAALGLDAEQAAAGMYRLVTAEMINAVRAVTVERGRDPRRFSLFAFGGALGVFAADIARGLGIGNVVVPAEAAVFSAHGLLDTDDVRVLARSAVWEGGDPADVEAVLRGLEREAMDSLGVAGYREDEIDVRWQGDFKFAGQLWEVTVPIPRGDSLTEADLQTVRDEFPARYEAEFGPGTAWTGTPVVMLTARVIATAAPDKFGALTTTGTESAASQSPTGRRTILRPIDDERLEVDVFRAGGFGPGDRIEGPALLEHPHTTIQLPPGWELRVDERGNFLLRDLALAEPAGAVGTETAAGS